MKQDISKYRVTSTAILGDTIKIFFRSVSEPYEWRVLKVAGVIACLASSDQDEPISFLDIRDSPGPFGYDMAGRLGKLSATDENQAKEYHAVYVFRDRECIQPLVTSIAIEAEFRVMNESDITQEYTEEMEGIKEMEKIDISEYRIVSSAMLGDTVKIFFRPIKRFRKTKVLKLKGVIAFMSSSIQNEPICYLTIRDPPGGVWSYSMAGILGKDPNEYISVAVCRDPECRNAAITIAAKTAEFRDRIKADSNFSDMQ